MANKKLVQELINYMIHWNLEQSKRSEEMLKRQIMKEKKNKKRGDKDDKR